MESNILGIRWYARSSFLDTREGRLSQPYKLRGARILFCSLRLEQLSIAH